MAASTNVERIRQYYNNDVQREWDRHERHRFEFPVTMHFLERFLKPGSRILDIGGGPGRYTLALAEAGHNVTLFDLAEANIAMAKEKADQMNLAVENFIQGDARDLSSLDGELFDAILIMGPFYHLSQKGDREKVIDQTLKLLKPQGILAGAFISHYAPIYDNLRNYPHTIKEQSENLLGFLKEGTHILSENEPGFIDAYFADPDEIVPFFSSFGLKELAFFGAESLISQSEMKLIDLGEELLAEWIGFACRTAETKGAIYGTDHLVYVGRKA
ncbi:class I SAM-dependent methyltransferase [Spirochaeta isovalerica]|uniref:2-polyprenyl-3-methyl-5-hydroxy-6-metoxy-1, 4-benzoquinol methylase n=1 Tax=Spirochaeta isovalerica TaxID=150 RepID=A0A841RDF1_9SPIO|nr:class I SAM-dependent methyltransferase [Spirochaeta isovalerica]MBB6480412.1 2-polyprenyl-3-methyl-5-hydroxy-6-metoxy-1,4-benzoquinol methylase [Spirochaeta isovalerica]